MPSRNNRRSKSKYLDNRRYNKKTSSTALKAIGYGLTAASLAAGGYYLYQGGHLKAPIHKALTALSKIRDNPITDANQGLRDALSAAKDSTDKAAGIIDDMGNIKFQNIQRKMAFTERMKDNWSKGLHTIRAFSTEARGSIEESVRLGKIRRGQLPAGIPSSKIMHGTPMIERLLHQKSLALKTIEEEVSAIGSKDLSLNVAQQKSNMTFAAKKLMNQEIIKTMTPDPKVQANLMKRTGARMATVGDLFDHHNKLIANQANHPNNWFSPLFESNIKGLDIAKDAIMRLKVDDNILIDELGNILDLRGGQRQLNNLLSSISNEFQVPFVGLNPFKMFQFDRIFAEPAPTFQVLKSNMLQPILTHGRNKLGKPLLFSNGSVVDLWSGQPNVVATDGYLVSDRRGMVAPALRKMSGIPMATMTPPDDTASIFHKARYKLGEKLSVGLQDQPTGFFRPTEPLSILYEFPKMLESKFPAYGTKDTTPFYAAFGGTETQPAFVFMNKFRGLSKFPGQSGGTDYMGFLKQFSAGRQNMQDVTTASFIPYVFFERMNATLNLAGLGFGMNELGSAGQIFKSYFTKRMLPIMGGIAAVKYIDYETEKLLGRAPSHMLAGAYADASVGMASIRDFTGITALGKKMERVMPGFEQIHEIPGLGFFNATRNREETREFWESGEVVRRKGRFWPYGNCVHPDTEIQLADGTIIAAKEVMVGDYVLTHLGKPHEVLQVIPRYMKSGEFAPEITLHGFPISIITTDNHPYLAVRPTPCTGSSYKECRPNRPCNLPKPYTQCKRRNEWTPEWTLARDLKPGDYLAYPRLKFKDESVDFEGIPLNKETGYLIGVILAEGNIDMWVRDQGYTLKTTHDARTERHIAEKLDKTINKYFGISGKIYLKDKNTLRYRVCGVEFVSWIQNMIYKGRDKVFPDLTGLPESFVQGILKGIFEGDGHLQQSGKDSLQMLLTAKRLNHIIGVRNILFAFGIPHSVIRHVSSERFKHLEQAYRIIITGDAAKEFYKLVDYYKPCPVSLKLSGVSHKHIYFDNDYAYIKIKSMPDSGYHDLVYDYEIDQAHSFCGLTTILHNTPYSGGRVEGHEPNWVRKVRSDWQYTDTLHGSKDEYWRNAAIPTPRYPLAPIRRFVTDPYRMEQKHYRDRPYLLTGGIPELEELPLIGPLANATIGRILKPQKKMHPEIWEQLEGQRPAGFTVLSSNQPINPLPKAYDKDWHHRRLNTGAAFNQVMGSDPHEVVVAVLDTGVDDQHPGLMGLTFKGVNTTGTGSRGDYTDRQGHGTHVSGIISAQGGDRKASAGMAPPVVKILPVKVLDDRGMGTKESIIEGMKYARKWRGPQGQRVSVVNMSLGAAGQFYDEDYWAEMQNLYESGILPVVASGNAGIPQVGTPAFYPDAMSVGATTPRDRRAWFSQYGEQLDIVAPGTDIRSTVPGGRYQSMSGTSMATPIVAATAAMLKAQQPDLSAAELRFILQATAEDLGDQNWDPEYGSGLVSPTFATRIASNKDANTRKMIQFGGKVMDDNIATERRLLLEQLQATVPAKMAYVEGQGIVHEGRTYNMPGTFKNVAYKTWHSLTELGGFYGFSMRVATADKRDEGHLIAEARAMTSYRRSFWDAQIGGFGGDANEILRRFTSKPEKWADRYNPVPNTMPSWMPGEDYMVNFKIGDPYIKIPDGEIRLPGEAYEAVHKVRSVEEAMQDPDIRRAIETGELHRGEFYDQLTRMRILADVAPWSREYKIAASQVSKSNLSDEEKKEAREIRNRLSERKEPMRLYDRKFGHANVTQQTAKITRVIDPNTFMVEGIDNPIRLAGVRVSTGQKNPDRIEAEKFLNKHLYKGARVRIAYDANPETRINQDTYRTISSVIYSNGMNLNKELINRGLGVEKEEDNSPAGIHARFSNADIAAGKAWESFSHLDTPFHTKFLQVRSPLEGYKRRDLYGKDFQNWKNPIKDFIVPSFESFASKGIWGVPAAIAFGTFFGRSSSPYAKVVGGTIAGTIAMAGVVNKTIYEAMHKEKWIPRRRRKEREVEEYMDALKYIKNLKLYREYAEQARSEEGINVQKEITRAEEQNARRSSAKRTLEDIKRQLHNGEPGRNLVREINRELKEKGFDYIRGDDEKELMKRINWNINRLTTAIKPELHGPLAQRAYSYYEQSKQTMQGFEQGGNMQHAMAALPKKDRKYLPYFMDAPAEEREEILASVPKYTRRVLQSIWGKQVDDKKDLEEFFTEYQLPDEHWEGWDEYSNLENVKVKIIKKESLDYSEFNVWPNDVARAEADPIRAPEMRIRDKTSTVRRRLEEILQGAGLEDVEIDVSYDSSNRFALDFEIEKDRRKELQQRMNELRKELA